MARVLVVVHDQQRRSDLEKGLPEKLPSYSYSFSASVDEAIAALADSSFDVVVSDARVPGFDDPILLRMVRQTYPHMIRIGLIDAASEANGLRLSQVAHQCLLRSSTTNEIAASIERTHRLQEFLEDPKVRERVTEVTNLPGPPQTYTSLVTAMGDPEVEMGDIAKVIEQDPMISAKILQLVNSAFFGRQSSTARLDDAVTFLGLSALRGLVLQLEVMRAFQGGAASQQGVLEGFQAHGLMVATSVSGILSGHPEAREGFTAGLLHDIGKLILADQEPENWSKVLDVIGRSGKAPFEVERDVFGTSHAEVGGALLSLWGLPATVVEAVAFHHDPQHAGAAFGIVGAVHIADAIVHEVTSVEERREVASRLNEHYVAEAGVAERIPSWQEAIGRRLSA